MTIRVVIAEDEAIIRLDLKETLEEEGYEVVGETGRGDTALQLVRDLHPDLAILDIKMPGMTGLEAAAQINAERRGIPGNSDNHDTIGMLALDANGNLSGACTTSGMAYKMHGRVGDSPIIGAGLYVDNEIGAATSTGVGEEVIRISGSHLVVELMRQGRTPEEACREAVTRIVKKQPQRSKELQVGFIAINRKVEFGAYCLQKGFNFAVKSAAHDNVLMDGKSYY